MTTVHFLYGSETGNAIDVTHDLARMALRRNLSPIVRGLEEVSIMDLQCMSTIVFVVSTTGDGDPPGNTVAYPSSLY